MEKKIAPVANWMLTDWKGWMVTDWNAGRKSKNKYFEDRFYSRRLPVGRSGLHSKSGDSMKIRNRSFLPGCFAGKCGVVEEWTCQLWCLHLLCVLWVGGKEKYRFQSICRISKCSHAWYSFSRHKIGFYSVNKYIHHA